MMSKDVQFLQLGMQEEELEMFDQVKIEYNKKVGNFLKKSRADSKRETCYVCGKECSSFCNSHSVPRFSLENIALNGYLYYSGNLVDMPMFDKPKGINEAGTFRIICRDCDSKVFMDYEDPVNYLKVPTGKMLSQIAMKNYLKNISKREYEISIYNNLSELTGNDMNQMQMVNNYDLIEYIDGFKFARKACESKWENNYFLCYFEMLDYVVPMAFQNNLSLISDFEGGIINDIYNHSPDYKLKDIHICVFPLESHSVVLMFIRNGEKRYRLFLKQFKKLTMEEKLKAINYIIFSYSEDVYIYKGLDKSILEDQELKMVAKQTPVAIANSPFAEFLEEAMDTYDLDKRNAIPNLLDRANRVR